MLSALFGPSKPKKKKKVNFHNPVITSEPYYPPSSSLASAIDSDVASVCAEAGTDEELDNFPVVSPAAPENENNNYINNNKDNDIMSSSDESSDAAPEWTQDEDRIICVRKSEEKSWAEIGKELKRSKKECQQRYRAISSQAKELGITTGALAKLYLDQKEEEEKAKQKKKKRQKKEKEKDSKESNKNQEKDKSPKKNTKADPETEKVGEQVEKKEENNTPEDPYQDYYDERRYLHETIYRYMYPDQKTTICPDRFYSESDCRVLAALEARHRANKWLTIQSEFYNATGRMVEAELLKAKFYEDENFA